MSEYVTYMQESIIDPKYHWLDHDFEWLAWFSVLYYEGKYPHLTYAMKRKSDQSDPCNLK